LLKVQGSPAWGLCFVKLCDIGDPLIDRLANTRDERFFGINVASIAPHVRVISEPASIAAQVAVGG
jgi:hypothetical protein